MLPLTFRQLASDVNMAPAKADVVPNMATTAGKAIAAMVLLQSRFIFCDDVVIPFCPFILGCLVLLFNVGLYALMLVHGGFPVFMTHDN